MSEQEFFQNITKYNVPAQWYSINDGLKPDAYILDKFHDLWEYYYFDEKGQRHDFRIFITDADAYGFLWSQIFDSMKAFRMIERD